MWVVLPGFMESYDAWAWPCGSGCVLDDLQKCRVQEVKLKMCELCYQDLWNSCEAMSRPGFVEFCEAIPGHGSGCVVDDLQRCSKWKHKCDYASFEIIVPNLASL